MSFKITTFLIGIVVVSLMFVGVGSYMAETSANYSVSYDNSTITTMNKLDDVYNISKDIEARHKADKTDRSLYDIVGNLIADGVDSIKLTFAGIGAGLSMTDQAIEVFGLDMSYKTAGFIIITIIIILGVLISAKVGRDL